MISREKNPVVVIGGYTEPKDILEGVAEAAVDLGFGHDAQIRTFHEAMVMDDQLLADELGKAASIVGHSAAPRAFPSGSSMRELSLIGPPEPRNVLSLGAAATRKSFRHWMGQSEPDYPREDQRTVVKGNLREFFRHPLANSKYPFVLSRYSTVTHIGMGKLVAQSLAIGYMLEDEYGYDYNEQLLWQNADKPVPWMVPYTCKLDGSHDKLVIDPSKILVAMRELHDIAIPQHKRETYRDIASRRAS